MKTTATAQVTVTLQIPAGSAWGPDCTAGQIQKQAIENVLGSLNFLVQRGHLKAKIVGQPKVTMVFAEMDDRTK